MLRLRPGGRFDGLSVPTSMGLPVAPELLTARLSRFHCTRQDILGVSCRTHLTQVWTPGDTLEPVPSFSHSRSE
jgi:hypothetical protein